MSRQHRHGWQEGQEEGTGFSSAVVLELDFHFQAKSATCGGLITDVVGALVLVLSAPLFLFGGFIMVFFYHVDTLDIASPWFSLLPKFFFSSGFNNLFCAASVISFRLLPISLFKKALFLLLILFLFTSCLLSGISTYGCFELQSIILQVSAQLTPRYSSAYIGVERDLAIFMGILNALP